MLTSISIGNSTPEVGDTITTALVPAGATATYQWYRGDVAIAGATSSSYTLTTADIGYTLKVSATGTGNYTGTVESGATNVVTGVLSEYPFHELRLQGLPCLSDTDVTIRCYLAAASTAASVGGNGD